MTHTRVDFIGFRRAHNGLKMETGGYDTDMTTAQAKLAAGVILGTYGYEKVSIEVAGVIIAVVAR